MIGRTITRLQEVTSRISDKFDNSILDTTDSMKQSDDLKIHYLVNTPLHCQVDKIACVPSKQPIGNGLQVADEDYAVNFEIEQEVGRRRFKTLVVTTRAIKEYPR
ncbi:hypothetical protein M8J76_011671 [Diaphorina citri]|nr:hypothetical protein M8J76_011671 [Diaphorina citri]